MAGRDLNATSTADYFGAFGYQNTVSARYTFVSGRGHSAQDEGCSAFGFFSEYEGPQTDNVMLQIGIGSSSSNRHNALTVRKSGAIEAKHLPVYGDNTAADAASLPTGAIYCTSQGELRIVV